MDSLFRKAADYAIDYLASVPSRPVAPSEEAIAATAAFDGPLPEGSTEPEKVLSELHEIGTPATIAMGGGRFFGFVIGGALPVTVAANWLATAWAVTCMKTPKCQTMGSVVKAKNSLKEWSSLLNP